MRTDAYGRAALEALTAYLEARKPTTQLTHHLMRSMLALMAMRENATVGFQIDGSPWFQCRPADDSRIDA